jgi:hypothetical protein
MKIHLAALAASTLLVPAAAGAAGACDKITGSYVAGRIGPFLGNAQFVSFDLYDLKSGVGSGNQVSMLSVAEAKADHKLISATACLPLTANSARVTFGAAVPGEQSSSAGSAVFTLFEGQYRERRSGALAAPRSRRARRPVAAATAAAPPPCGQQGTPAFPVD